MTRAATAREPDAPPLPPPFEDGRFAELVIGWQATHGRHDLPWQRHGGARDPYRVWLSEIMLQQTQVATVRDYFTRFVARFPDVAALAAGSEDKVLALWSGLGYYSRARNLHRCAREVVERHGGEFPRSAAALAQLPGIGRSTAAAIAAFCFGERVAIFDGNVRRVLARALGFERDLALSANERALWGRATELLPRNDRAEAMPRYTQGLMDLGATICRARRPACLLCPLHDGCAAFRSGDTERLPVRTGRVARREIDWWLLIAIDERGRVWFERRAGGGIWAGLHCVPVFERHDAFELALHATAGAANARGAVERLPALTHALTHRELRLHPVVARVRSSDWPPVAARVAEPEPEPVPTGAGRWLSREQWRAQGLPAPIRKLLDSVR